MKDVPESEMIKKSSTLESKLHISVNALFIPGYTKVSSICLAGFAGSQSVLIFQSSCGLSALVKVSVPCLWT